MNMSHPGAVGSAEDRTNIQSGAQVIQDHLDTSVFALFMWLWLKIGKGLALG